MFKKKSIWIVIGLVFISVAVAVATIGLGTSIEAKEFDKNGYIIVANEQAEATRYAFSAGTEYKKTYGNQYTFKDVSKENIEVDQEAFVHYEDDSMSALSKGVVVDLSEVDNSNSIHHYALSEGMSLASSASKYQIENANGTVEMEEAVWKVSDSKYLVAAKNMDVIFSKDDKREAGSFVEFDYIDEGVVQIVTKDNVWQTVSSDAIIRTSNGNEIHLADQVIQNKKGKLPLSKMVIDAEDNVELSPLETREQKVPEFDIDAQNGENGTSGESGVEGVEGKEGSQGEQGQNGENGENGASGENGVSGESGANGASGNDGSGGNKGSAGKPGSNGTNATNNSSSKTAIPEFSLTDWEVNATSVKGTIRVEDINGMIQDQKARIDIYDASNGEHYIMKNDKGNPEFEFVDDFSFDSEGHLFMASEGDEEGQEEKEVTLQPDHEYRLVVSANYEMNSENFTREFISRVFYTDSMGVFMEKVELSPTSITGKLTRNSYSTAGSVKLHLLTEQELAEFAKSGKGGIEMDITLTKDEETFTFDMTKHPTMKRNTIYYVRMVVNSSDGSDTYLSPQILKVATLKQQPKIEGTPFASPNRKLGAFELYGGSVIDEDSAIISHRYEVYKGDSVVSTLDVKPSPLTNMTLLNIDGNNIKKGERYKFRVVTIYNDNEKTVEFTSPFSSEFVMNGSSYPVIYFDAKDKQSPDRFYGHLVIDLPNDASILVDGTKPIDLRIEAEGIFDKEISITSLDSNNITSTPTEIRIPLDEEKLKQQTSYRITVHAYIKSDQADADGNSVYNQVNLGYVIVDTRALATLTCDWRPTQAANAIQQSLQFPEESVDPSVREDLNLMSEIIVELYQGNVTSAQPLGRAIFTNTAGEGEENTLVRDFVKNARVITENDFSNVSADQLTGTSYTMKVTAVYDETRIGEPNDGNTSKYVNTFEVVNSSVEITKQKVPPTLPNVEDLDKQIDVMPITNEMAARYGVSYDPNLDADSIIGFQLSPLYQNYASLARSITFHIYEAKDYEQTLLDGYDPNKETDSQIYEVTIPIKSTSTRMPMPAIIFGEGKDNESNDIYYAGNKIPSAVVDKYPKGMQRGYQYVATYTVAYNPTGIGEANKEYPYNHPDYNNITSNQTIPYYLNSGNIKAPKTEPKFYTIPWQQSFANNTTQYDVYYAYRDVDQTINYRADEDEIASDNDPAATDITIDGVFKKDIAVQAEKWGKVTLTDDKNRSVLEPMIQRALYEKEYSDDPNDKQTAMFKYAVSSPAKRANIYDVIHNGKITLDLNEDKNNIAIEVRFENEKYDNAVLMDAINHVAGVQMTFSDKNDPDNPDTTKTFNLTLEKYGMYSLRTNLSTSMLENLVGKQVQVDSKILYDSGEQGWSFAKNSKNDLNSLFAYQLINEDGTYGKYLSTTYYTEKENAMGSMLYQTDMFETDLNKMDMNMIEKSIDLKPYDPTKHSWTDTLQFTRNGVSRYDALNPSALSIRVPKKIKMAEYTSKEGEENKNPIILENFPINKIVPSVSVGDHSSNLYSVFLTNIQVNGLSQIKEDENGNKIVYATIKSTEDVNDTQTKEIIYKNGDTSAKNLTFDSLQLGTQYTITFSADDLAGNRMQLLDTNKAEPVIFQMIISTLGKIEFNQPTIGYRQDCYQYHSMTVSYYTYGSGFDVRYTLYESDKSGVISESKPYKTHDEMLAAGVFEPLSSYSGHINHPFRFDIRSDIKIEPGHYYVLRMQAINQNSEDKEVLGTAYVPFYSPQNMMPIPYIETNPIFEKGKASLDVSFNLPDSSKVIMTKLPELDSEPQEPEVPTYYFRIFEQNGNTWKDITKQNDQVQELYEVDKLYKLHYDDLNTDTVYRVVLYAAVDLNRDMKHELNGKSESLQELQESLSEEEFEELLNSEYVLWEEECVTPGENGIAFGDIGIENPNGNQQYVSISFKNAANLNVIEQVEYNMISDNGANYSGILTNSESQPLFRLKDPDTQGYYLLDLPDMLEKTGDYRIVVQMKVRNQEGKLETIKTYSNRYLYK